MFVAEVIRKVCTTELGVQGLLIRAQNLACWNNDYYKDYWGEMNDHLKNILNRVRERLESNPKGIVIGQIRNSCNDPGIEDRNSVLAEYIEFLKECDGASFGEIDIFSLSELSRNQFYVETLKGGKEDWLFIGLILYEPIVINKTSGNVYRLYRDVITSTPEESFGSFNNFLVEFALGQKYLDIVPVDHEDEWMSFLRRLNCFK